MEGTQGFAACIYAAAALPTCEHSSSSDHRLHTPTLHSVLTPYLLRPTLATTGTLTAVWGAAAGERCRGCSAEQPLQAEQQVEQLRAAGASGLAPTGAGPAAASWQARLRTHHSHQWAQGGGAGCAARVCPGYGEWRPPPGWALVSPGDCGCRLQPTRQAGWQAGRLAGWQAGRLAGSKTSCTA